MKFNNVVTLEEGETVLVELEDSTYCGRVYFCKEDMRFKICTGDVK